LSDAGLNFAAGLSADLVFDLNESNVTWSDAFFFWSQDGNNILLNYSPVPEPASYAALFGLLALGLAAARR
jgi:PEP-CTERM putative exosortase interaction domain